MKQVHRTILTTIAFLSLAIGIISFFMVKYIDLFCHVLRGAVIAFIVCVCFLKE